MTHRHPHLRNAEVEFMSMCLAGWSAVVVALLVRHITRSKGYTP